MHVRRAIVDRRFLTIFRRWPSGSIRNESTAKKYIEHLFVLSSHPAQGIKIICNLFLKIALRDCAQRTGTIISGSF